MIPTPHIELDDKKKIAKTVLMPGDPLRAKYIAETYLEDVEQFNTIRNMFGYTGTYKGKKISVMGSGMGMASIGIYSYELFDFYDVDNIIRIGSAGAYQEDLNLYEVVLATSSWSESTFSEIVTGEKTNKLYSNEELNQKIRKSAQELNIPLKEGNIHSSDVFYRKNFDDYKQINKEHDCICVEMESFALFANANATGKKATCLITISDNLVTQEATTAIERQNSFHNMMEIALNAEY